MCGLAGFLSNKRHAAPPEAIARAMADAIRHRGPDDEGVWLDAEAGLALAHRRLSIIDLSPAGHQPMVSASGKSVIAFNGEIYNHMELRKLLEREGRAPSWRGHSDTETLLEAAAAWGIERALGTCVGMFAFALWDRRERTLTLARDRLGEKPLYYGWAGDTFLFASELAALSRHPDWSGEIDRGALALMLRFNNVPAPHSIYKGMAKLRPGTYGVLRHGARSLEEHVYWDASQIAEQGQRAPFAGSADDALAEVERLLKQSLAGQMVADVPLGAFLSGGIDSSTIVALMQEMGTRPVKTFSIGFAEAGYDEAAAAGAVARHLGTDHHEFIVSAAEAQAVIPRLPAIYSEPFADSSQIPTFLVSELARRHVTVSLSGDGGDEVFCGYRRYAYAADVWPKLERVPRALRSGAAGVIRSIGPGAWNLATGSSRNMGDKLHKAARVMALDGTDAVYRALVSHWPEPDRIAVGGAEPKIKPPAALRHGEAVRRMMLLDTIGYLPDDILVKVDRASMAVSLESRVPYLDHRLVELAWSLPTAILRRGGQSKWPLRELLYRRVPRQLVERPKAGFAIPLATWLRGPLRAWAEELIGETRLKREGYFNPEPIRAAWTDLLTEKSATEERIWNVLMFQAWREAVAKSASAAPPRAARAASS